MGRAIAPKSNEENDIYCSFPERQCFWSGDLPSKCWKEEAFAQDIGLYDKISSRFLCTSQAAEICSKRSRRGLFPLCKCNSESAYKALLLKMPAWAIYQSKVYEQEAWKEFWRCALIARAGNRTPSRTLSKQVHFLAWSGSTGLPGMANGQACCAHDHDCEAADCGPAYSLHKHINFSGVSFHSDSSHASAACCDANQHFLFCIDTGKGLQSCMQYPCGELCLSSLASHSSS